MRFAVLFTLGVASTFGHDPFSSLATRRVALARAAAVAGTGLWRSAVLAEDSAAAATSEAYDASAVAPEVLPPPAPPAPPAISAFDFDVPFRGEPREITPFLGRANLLVNVKFDDPETLDQMPAIGDMVSRYSERGLHVLAFPTDQGWFEADDSNTLRLKYKSVYGFGQYPAAVVFDKTDLLGGNALPLYTWMTKTLSNPWGVNRLVFNYEKFLVDERGQPRRRYPRKFPIQLMDADVRRARCGCDTPPPYSVVPPPMHMGLSRLSLVRSAFRCKRCSTASRCRLRARHWKRRGRMPNARQSSRSTRSSQGWYVSSAASDAPSGRQWRRAHTARSIPCPQNYYATGSPAS